MNPILLYPQNAADAKFFRESAEKRGAKPTRLSLKDVEAFDEWLFAQKLVAIDKNSKNVSEAKVMATFDKIINGK